MEWIAETTDTFGGQANYSWTRRVPFETDATASRLTIVRRGKAAAGLTGARCRVTDFGSLIELRPYGECTVTFLTPV